MVLQWISCLQKELKYYKERYERLIEEKSEGTCQWLLEEDVYIKWMQSESPDSVLWIHGNPGVGKSMLTATAINHLSNLSKKTKNETVKEHLDDTDMFNDYIVLYFFVDGRDLNKTEPVWILKSLTYQLIRFPQFPENHLLEHAYERSALDQAVDFDQVWDLFLALLHLLTPGHTKWILIDGLDECQCPDKKKFVQKLLGLISNPLLEVKLFVTSRTSDKHLLELLTGFISFDQSHPVQN